MSVAHDDPLGFQYFETKMNSRTPPQLVVDNKNLTIPNLNFVAANVALPWNQMPHSNSSGYYAYVLGDGQKMLPGEKIVFSPLAHSLR